jgi:hypothetical protein
MALFRTDDAEFPDVPKTAGVPPVNRDARNPGDATTQALSDDTINVASHGKDAWGIYDSNNAKALTPDTIIAVGYQAEHRIADFPIEEGGFESYNKVAMPFDTRVVMTKGGTYEERRTFAAAIEELRGDMKLYSVVTPERTYLSVNFSRVSIDRSREQGAGLITVELHLTEIRQNATATFSKAKEPASADTKSNGSVQAMNAAPAETATVAAKSATVAAVSPPEGKSFFSGVAGQVLKSIPLVAGIASQGMSVQLASQAVGMVLSQKRTGLFADIHVGGVPAALGVLVRDGVPLLRAAGADLPGNLAIFDMHGSSDPDYTGLGDRFKLFWAA